MEGAAKTPDNLIFGLRSELVVHAAECSFPSVE